VRTWSDPTAPNALVMPRPSNSHQVPVYLHLYSLCMHNLLFMQIATVKNNSVVNFVKINCKLNISHIVLVMPGF